MLGRPSKPSWSHDDDRQRRYDRTSGQHAAEDVGAVIAALDAFALKHDMASVPFEITTRLQTMFFLADVLRDELREFAASREKEEKDRSPT